MNNSNPDEQKEIICSCSGTTKAKINQLISNGADSIDKISSATGACTGCGACDASILELLDNFTESGQSS